MFALVSDADLEYESPWDAAPWSRRDDVGNAQLWDVERQWTTRSHGATTLKAVTFILAAVRTWNLT
jgi:hypothetical protein